MNMLDMHTREKVNKLHIAQMQQEARNRRFSRDLNAAGIIVLPKGRIALVLMVAILVLLLGASLISPAI